MEKPRSLRFSWIDIVLGRERPHRSKTRVNEVLSKSLTKEENEGGDTLVAGGWGKKTGPGLASPRVRKEAREQRTASEQAVGPRQIR